MDSCGSFGTLTIFFSMLFSHTNSRSYVALVHVQLVAPNTATVCTLDTYSFILTGMGTAGFVRSSLLAQKAAVAFFSRWSIAWWTLPYELMMTPSTSKKLTSCTGTGSAASHDPTLSLLHISRSRRRRNYISPSTPSTST